jgi:hypothetical protein
MVVGRAKRVHLSKTENKGPATEPCVGGIGDRRDALTAKQKASIFVIAIRGWSLREAWGRPMSLPRMQRAPRTCLVSIPASRKAGHERSHVSSGHGSRWPAVGRMEWRLFVPNPLAVL